MNDFFSLLKILELKSQKKQQYQPFKKLEEGKKKIKKGIFKINS